MLRHICSFFNCGGEITSYSAGVAALYIVGANAVAVKINKSAQQLNGVPENSKVNYIPEKQA